MFSRLVTPLAFLGNPLDPPVKILKDVLGKPKIWILGCCLSSLAMSKVGDTCQWSSFATRRDLGRMI